MHVNSATPAQGAPLVSRDSQDSAIGADARRPDAGTPAQDSVQISAAGRAKAAASGASLSPERVKQLRQDILDGKLDSVEVLNSTARRIIARGDA